MGQLELIVGAALGLAIGFWAGQFLRALLIYWESADVAVKSLKSTVFFLVGGGGGATLTSVFVSRGATTCYLGGLALGLVVGRCVPLPRARSPRATQHGFTAARRLPGNLKPSDDVDLLIRLRMDPPRRVQRELRVGEKELARRIEAALDTWAELEEPPPADDSAEPPSPDDDA